MSRPGSNILSIFRRSLSLRVEINKRRPKEGQKKDRRIDSIAIDSRCQPEE